jgi:hypothetical protein
MKRLIDALVLLALVSLLGFFVQGPGRLDAAPARPMNHAARNAPLTMDRATKFDLLFTEPELARP